jgi:hypothetical protein
VVNAGIFVNGKLLRVLQYFSTTLMAGKISFGFLEEYDFIGKIFYEF